MSLGGLSSSTTIATNMKNAPVAPSAASTPQTIDHGDGSSAAAIVPSTAVVANTNQARRGLTGGGIRGRGESAFTPITIDSAR